MESNFFYFKVPSLYWVILIIECGMKVIDIMSPLSFSWNIYIGLIWTALIREMQNTRGQDKKRERGWGIEHSSIQGSERKIVSFSKLTFLIPSFWRGTIEKPGPYLNRLPCILSFLLPNTQQHNYSNFISSDIITANVRQLWYNLLLCEYPP